MSNADKALTLLSKLSQPVSADVREARHQAARAEWLEVLAAGDLHAAAMWLQNHGHRLPSLKQAHTEWNEAAR